MLGRWKDTSSSHHVGLFNVMKGVTLAAVGLVLLQLATSSLPHMRALMLVVAFLAVIISYNGAAVGTSVVNFHPSLIDVVLPMLMTVSELVLIARLGAEAGSGELPGDWLIALGIWQLLAALIVLSVAMRIRRSEYDIDAWTYVEQYRSRLRIDCGMAMIGAVAAMTFWMVRRDALPDADAPEYAFIAFVTAWFLAALRHHGAARRSLVRGFTSAP